MVLNIGGATIDGVIERIQDGDSNDNKTLPYPCSLDVVSLYTSIPIQEAIDNTVDRIEHSMLHLSRLDVAELLNFTFEDRIFRQTEGLPMGSSISGILAILFMDKLEQIVLSSYRLIGPYKRYVDDIYLQTANEEKANEFHDTMNSLHPETKI
ncbi:telomerase reverse transcriptase-like [Pocillopora verrucosa]|uniref:telomerase reverse transcriptase-like n=1 Tax=Pocillopora verrucosa TaxID=203993 RepID=UPI00333E29B8